MFAHDPVMKAEVIALLGGRPGERLVDCTVGGAGHSIAMLESFPSASVLGIDRDPDAIATARERLERFGSRAAVVHAPFSGVIDAAHVHGWAVVDGLLADLGVSSYQLDHGERGMSFRADGPVDMRMDTSSGEPLSELLERTTEDELAQVIRDYGEERHARRVARRILERRPTSTAELANAVRSVVPKSNDGLDAATRTFQGLRIWVNDELGELERLLAALPYLLCDGGIAVFLSYHSLEDRAVKRAFQAAANPCTCPPALPQCVCGKVATMRIVSRRAERPTDEEIRRNPRARSAKLRAAVRIGRAA